MEAWHIVHWLVAEWKSDSTFLYNSTPHCFLHHCICYTQVWMVEFLQREIALHSTACLLTNTSTDVNTTVMWWWISPNKTCILESLGENVGLHLVILTKRFLKIRLSFPTHNCPNISQKILTILSVTTFFSLYTPFSYQEMFLMQTIRRKIAQLFMSQSNSRHTCNTATHNATITAYVTEGQVQKQQEYQFQWLLPLHSTLLSLTGSYTDANRPVCYDSG
jgi:hypothetical protein